MIYAYVDALYTYDASLPLPDTAYAKVYFYLLLFICYRIFCILSLSRKKIHI
jgi:hypothetical protein